MATTFDDLYNLSENWDSYGAKPISPKCIEKARDLWYSGKLRDLSKGEWQIVPCSCGGVQIEAHDEEFGIEIFIAPAEE
jgi:hypothetical protein